MSPDEGEFNGRSRGASRWWPPAGGIVGGCRRRERLLGPSRVSSVLVGDGAGLRLRPRELRPVLARAAHRRRRRGANRRVRLDRLAGGAPVRSPQRGPHHCPARVGASFGQPPGCCSPSLLRTPGAHGGETRQPSARTPSRAGAASQVPWCARSSRPGAAPGRWSPRAPATTVARVAGSGRRVGLSQRSRYAPGPGDRVVDGLRWAACRRGPLVAPRRCRPGPTPCASCRQGRSGTNRAG